MKPFESEDITSKQHEPCFFLDRTADNATLLEGLRNIGCLVIPHRARFKHDEDDDVWIKDVANRGWIIITHDKDIRYRPLEIKSVIVHRARMICLTNGGMIPTSVLDVLKSGMGLIRKYIKENEPPYILRIRRGDGRRQKVTLNPLKLPIEKYLNEL